MAMVVWLYRWFWSYACSIKTAVESCDMQCVYVCCICVFAYVCMWMSMRLHDIYQQHCSNHSLFVTSTRNTQLSLSWAFFSFRSYSLGILRPQKSCKILMWLCFFRLSRVNNICYLFDAMQRQNKFGGFRIQNLDLSTSTDFISMK